MNIRIGRVDAQINNPCSDYGIPWNNTQLQLTVTSNMKQSRVSKLVTLIQHMQKANQAQNRGHETGLIK